MAKTTFCLDCEHQIELGHDPQIGQRIKCPYCEVELEIINLDPPELDWIYERINPGTEFDALIEGL
jgi:lysine biosynthesis protein LysW